MTAVLLALATESAGGGTVPDWLGPVIALTTLMIGSGGIVAWRRLTHDKRIGVAQQEQAEDAALSNRWAAIIETQTKSLLEPMAVRLKSLEESVEKLESELAQSRRKYWSAVAYIRQLLLWIARHMPEDNLDHTVVPQAPATLAEDL